MRPEDDPTWPTCSFQKDPVMNCPEFRAARWCDHLRDKMRKGLDSPGVIPGTRVCVPIVPLQQAWAEVAIDDNEIMPGVAALFLVRSLPFSTDENLINLGMWTQGEGRWAISSVVQDWFRTRVPEDSETACPQKTHGFAEMRIIENKKNDPLWMKANAWSIVYRDMCRPCYAKYEQFGDPANFGLDGVQQTAANTPAGQALRNRFS